MTDTDFKPMTQAEIDAYTKPKKVRVHRATRKVKPPVRDNRSNYQSTDYEYPGDE